MQDKIICEQAEWERERPVKPFLDKVGGCREREKRNNEVHKHGVKGLKIAAF